MATRPLSWRSLPPFVRVMLVIVAFLLFAGIALDRHPNNARNDATGTNSTGVRGAVRSGGGDPDLAIVAVRPISSVSNTSNGEESNRPIQVKLGDVVAYSGLLHAAPTSTPTAPPTPPGLDNYTPLVPDSSPTIYVTNVDGRFFYGGDVIFTASTQTPPAFTQVFPLINFNPPAGYTCNGTPVDGETRPLTDVDEGVPCAAIPAQATAPAPTPTLLQAGVGVLAGYQAVFSTTIYVSQPADISFYLHSDNAFVFGIGPLNGVPGSWQPYRVSGTYDPPPPPSPTPYPTTTFRNLTIVARYNTGGCCNGAVTVGFPVAGFYPIEIDNSEDGNDGLDIALENPSGTPVLNGPSATPTPTVTPTATFTCIPSSQWCVGSSVNLPGANSLNGVAAIAQNDVWVGGWHTDPTPGIQVSLMEHWNGNNWNVVSVPTSIGSINGLVAPPTAGPTQQAEVWAGSDTGIIHWNGTAWSTPYPGVPGAKTFAAFASNDVYAAGGTLIQHWNGSAWATATSVSTGSTLNGITAFTDQTGITPKQTIWAVGSSGSGPFSMRWNGSAWASISVPTPTGATSASLNSITAINNTVYWGLWAVGTYVDAQGHHTLTEYYNSTGSNGYPVGWFIVPSPDPDTLYQVNELHSVFRTRTGDVWAVGTYANPSGVENTLILHWNGSQWDIAQSTNLGINDNELNGITSHSPATSDWAAGYADDASATPQTLVENLTAPIAKPVTRSYYEVQVTPTVHRGQGCNAAATAVSGVVVLDYGKPAIGPGPLYGTILINSGAFASIDQIKVAAEAFADGYDTCRPDRSNQTIRMAISVNNGYSTALNSDHGQQWAHMVATVQAYATTYPGFGVAGGIDAEEGDGFDPGFTSTQNWLAGFIAGGTAPYYDFGAIDTFPCRPAPGIGTPTPVVPYPEPCSGWNVDQHYQIAYGLAPNQALPLLETYTSSKTGYIYPVTRWGKDQYNKPMKLYGQMTDCHAGCIGELNTTQGWPVLWLALNGDRQTSQSPPYSTDIGNSNSDSP